MAEPSKSMNKELIIEVCNVESDDDEVSLIETDPLDIDIVILSDDEIDETNTSLTSITNPTILTNPMHKINVLEKVRLNHRKFKNLQKGGKQFGKLVPKLEPTDDSYKKQKNDNNHQSNELLYNVQIEKQPSISSNNLSISDNLDVQVENNELQEDTSDRNLVLNNSLGDSSSNGEILELQVEPFITVKDNLQNDSTNPNVVTIELNEPQATCGSSIEETVINVSPSRVINHSENTSVNQNVNVNQSQAEFSCNIEKTGFNVEPPTLIEHDDIQNISTNQNAIITHKQQHKQAMPNMKVFETTGFNVEPPRSLRDHDDLQNVSKNPNVITSHELQAMSNSKILEKSGLNVTSPTSMNHSNLQDDSINRNIVKNKLNEIPIVPKSNLEKTVMKINPSTAVGSSNSVEDISKNENVDMIKPQAGSSSRIERVTLPNASSNSFNSFKLPTIQSKFNNYEFNRNKNLMTQQYTPSNTYFNPKSRIMQDQPNKDVKFEKSEYLDPLLSVVVEEGYPDVRYLNEYHLHAIRRLVGFEIDHVLSVGNFVPRFLSSYAKCGVILVKSADSESQTWLQSIVPKLDPGPGVKLTVMALQELNRMYKVKIRVFHDNSEQQILTRLQKQNPDINMISWQLLSVYRFQGERPGVILFMSIPAYYFQLLKDREFKLHYGLYQVHVEMKEAYSRKMY